MTVFSSIFAYLAPVLAWLALIYFALRWLFRRWETRVFAEAIYRLKLPMSPLAFLDRKILIESLVNDPVIQAALERQSRTAGESLQALQKRARSQAREIVPAFKAVAYFRIIYWLARFLIRIQYRVKVVSAATDAYKGVGPGATVVLVMNHRSNMDVLLANYLTSRHSTLSHAAGEWARTWPLHHIVRWTGNYVVDRDSDDPLYRLLLKRYLQMAVTHGISVAIFPEGELTRNGEMQAPQFGLLNYIATAQWPGMDRDIVFIPTSFNYDRVPEQEQLVLGSEQKFRERGKLYVFLAAIKYGVKYLLLPLTPRARRNGYACACFGEPVSLKAWESNRGIQLRRLDSGQRRAHIDSLGRQLMRSIEDSIPVLPTHLLALALSRAGSPQPEVELRQHYLELVRAVQLVGAPWYCYDLDPGEAFTVALESLQRAGALRRSADAAISVEPGRESLLAYYANSVCHYLRADRAIMEGNQLPDSAEPGATRIPHTVGNLLSVYVQSHDRVMQRQIDGESFFDDFYRRFLDSSEQVAAQFANTDMATQHAHLRESLHHMVDYCIANKASDRMLKIAYQHGRNGRDIAPELYDLWLQSLLASVARYDPDFDLSVDLAWRALMAPGISFMRSNYQRQRNPDSSELQVQATPVGNQGIARWLEHWALRSPDKIALCGADRQLTYQQLDEEVQRLACALCRQLNVEQEDRVVYVAGNRVEFVALLFACARLGALLVPLNTRLAAQEQLRMVDLTEPRVLFGDRASLQKLSPGALPSTTLVTLDDSGASTCYADLIAPEPDRLVNRGTLQSPLLIVFTSGTTGSPKGAVLTQGAIHWNALNSRLMHDLRRDDHVVTMLPFFHVGGINIQTLPALQCGATVSVVDGFDAAGFVALVEARKPSLTVLVPAQMRQLMALDNWTGARLGSLRLVATGSTVVAPELITAWRDRGIPLIQVYGCTESCPIAIHQTVEGIKTGLGTVGHGALYCDVQVQNAQGEALADSMEGEIVLRGPHIMSHYWRNEEASEAAFREGWLLTGDMGYRDQNGRLHITGRKKQLIISGGENIHPGEIERALEACPGVAEAAVIGIADPRWEEVPVAVVVTAGVAEQVIRDHLDRHLGRYKHPQHIFFTDRLPRTALDKIAYPQVAVFVGEQLADDSGDGG